MEVAVCICFQTNVENKPKAKTDENPSTSCVRGEGRTQPGWGQGWGRLSGRQI